eukprot:14154445-Ditylum_brightwellii.AAC.1
MHKDGVTVHKECLQTLSEYLATFHVIPTGSNISHKDSMCTNHETLCASTAPKVKLQPTHGQENHLWQREV